MASLEVDQRQNFIQQADTLREMIGASGLISLSVPIAEEVSAKFPTVKLFWPVSGVLRFRAGDLDPLYRCLREIRLRLEDAGLTSSIGIVELGPDLDAANVAIDRKVRQRKDSKSGAVARPSSPYFAPCGIQPQLPANHWRPHQRQNDARRRLTSHPAERRRLEHTRSEEVMYRRLNRRELKIPYQMQNLVVSSKDSYIAVIKADVDGLGRLLAELHFRQLGVQLGLDPIDASTEFTKALDFCVKEAALAVMNELSERHAPGNRHYPFVPLILAGDDLLILAQRHLALDLVWHLNRRYHEEAARHPVLRQAFAVSGMSNQESLTLSFGVLFCKQGFPFDAGVDMAEELVHSAKHLRHQLAPEQKEGCVDFHWLASSGRESVAEARCKGEIYRDGDDLFSLVTRPWRCSELDHHVPAAHAFATLPSRKAHQLDTVLRLGATLSGLAWKKWLASLQAEERAPFQDTPWLAAQGNNYSTHWLDVAQMAETMRLSQEDPSA